jgi:hypothetical protein
MVSLSELIPSASFSKWLGPEGRHGQLHKSADAVLKVKGKAYLVDPMGPVIVLDLESDIDAQSLSRIAIASGRCLVILEVDDPSLINR